MRLWITPQNKVAGLVDRDEGICILAGIPLPHRSLGIIDLERKCEKIYRAQSLTGKILRSKDLCSAFLQTIIPPGFAMMD
jgi:hypothetical protein